MLSALSSGGPRPNQTFRQFQHVPPSPYRGKAGGPIGPQTGERMGEGGAASSRLPLAIWPSARHPPRTRTGLLLLDHAEEALRVSVAPVFRLAWTAYLLVNYSRRRVRNHNSGSKRHTQDLGALRGLGGIGLPCGSQLSWSSRPTPGAARGDGGRGCRRPGGRRAYARRGGL